jgi:8-oxo-dGTP diphosphatase
VGGEARVNDEESLDVRWHPLDALPELDEDELSLLTQAVRGNGRAAYEFSGLGEVLGSAG